VIFSGMQLVYLRKG